MILKIALGIVLGYILLTILGGFVAALLDN